jgi:hypothetical protein
MKRARALISDGEYADLLARAGGACQICGAPPKSRRLHVDHDHTTGRIRGLLCHRCNRGLSWFRDRSDLLRTAAGYVDGLRYPSNSRG